MARDKSDAAQEVLDLGDRPLEDAKLRSRNQPMTNVANCDVGPANAADELARMRRMRDEARNGWVVLRRMLGKNASLNWHRNWHRTNTDEGVSGRMKDRDQARKRQQISTKADEDG